MTGSIPPAGPLAYEGQVTVPFIMRTFSPLTTFNQFPVPTIWVNTASKNAYILVNKALGVATWALVGGSPGSLDTLTMPDMTVVTPVASTIQFLNGTGMSVTGSSNDVTFSTVGGGLTWSTVTGATALVANNGYVANNAGGVAFSLPTSNCAVGSIIAITNITTGNWSISQAVGQQIQVGKFTTTSGVGGSLSSTHIGDTVFLLCTVANTNFLMLSAVGDLTYV